MYKNFLTPGGSMTSVDPSGLVANKIDAFGPATSNAAQKEHTHMSANLYDGESCMSSHVFSSLHRGVSVEVMLGHVCVLFFTYVYWLRLGILQ